MYSITFAFSCSTDSEEYVAFAMLIVFCAS